MSDPKLPIGSRRCRCAGCGEYFNSEWPFSEHRVGAFGVDRRCLTSSEMIERGFSQISGGYWVRKKFLWPEKQAEPVSTP